MSTLRELLEAKKDDKKIKIYIDNDIIFGIKENTKFNMHPQDALIEALELLGFKPEVV